MNHLKKSHFLYLLLIVLTFSSCETEEGVNAKKETLYELVSQRDDWSSLANALQITGLDETLSSDEEYTLFAPSNAAFSAFLAENNLNSINEVPVDYLRQLLLNHVIQGKIKKESFPSSGYLQSLATGFASTSNHLSLYFRKTDDLISINGASTFDGTNVIASNGVIYNFNSVLKLPTIVDHIVANPNLESLFNALDTNDQYDFIEELSSITNGPYTLFAPTDSAFPSLLTELNQPSLDVIDPAIVAQVLKYHVAITSNTLSGNLNHGDVINTFQGNALTIQLTPANFRLVDYNNRLSNFTTRDIQCYNGIIHMVDRVLLPNLN